MKISQSLIKDWMAYQKGELCGTVFYKRWIEGVSVGWTDSPAMKMGRFFEYQLTGAKPLKHPTEDLEPELLKSGANKGKPKADYENAIKKVSQTLDLLDQTGISIVDAQKKYERNDLIGEIDIIADFKGEQVVIDVKYSGVIDDKWSLFGWQWTPEQSFHHAIQAKHYSYITGLEFYYLVVSAGKDKDIRLFKPQITPDMIEKHVEYAYLVRDMIQETDMLGGWKDYPGHKRCGSCAIRNTCENRANKLRVEEIKL